MTKSANIIESLKRIEKLKRKEESNGRKEKDRGYLRGAGSRASGAEKERN